MIKKVKAFTLIEMLVVLGIICIIAAVILPAFVFLKRHTQQQSVTYQVGEAVYIDTLCITGIVNGVNNLYQWPRVSLLIKGTNGLPSQLELVDVRLLKKVPPSPQSEWTH